MQTELLRIWQRTPKTVIFVTHDVQEAVYLADRVAVMSARPGRIKAIVDTKFDKNDPDILRSKAFVEKVDEIWNLVRDEAIKAQEQIAQRSRAHEADAHSAICRCCCLRCLGSGGAAQSGVDTLGVAAVEQRASRPGST